MSESQKHTELLHAQLKSENSHSNNNSSSEEPSFHEEYDDSGLWVRSFKDEFIITIGKFCIANDYKTKDEAMSAIARRDYKVILGLIDAFVTFRINFDDKTLIDEFSEDEG